MDIKQTELFQTGFYINGSWLQSDRCYAVTNPATNKKIADVASAGEPETRAAIEAATTAFKLWRKKTAKERSQVVRRWGGELMMEHQHDLAIIMTTEQGKPYAESLGGSWLCGKLFRMVCRRRQAYLWRNYPDPQARFENPCDQRAHWCCRGRLPRGIFLWQ